MLPVSVVFVLLAPLEDKCCGAGGGVCFCSADDGATPMPLVGLSLRVRSSTASLFYVDEVLTLRGMNMMMICDVNVSRVNKRVKDFFQGTVDNTSTCVQRAQL